MTKLYPLFLNLNNKNCVVIGAGEVASRKSERLVECGARVTVVGRTPVSALLLLHEEGTIDLVEEDYRSSHLEGAFLVIGATDREEVNSRIHADAEARGLLINIVDRPELCNFIVPALSRRGDLTVAVSTGGRSPAMARRIRDDIEVGLDEGYGPFLVLMGVLRKKILARGRSSNDNRVIFEALADSELLMFVREKQWDKARDLVFELTGEEVALPADIRIERQTGDNE